MSAALIRSMEAPPFCEQEALRYAGCREKQDDTLRLLYDCLNEARDKLTYQVCYCEFPLKISGNRCLFDAFEVESAQLAKNLAGCSRCLIFAATVGVGIDRLIARYGRIAPSKALMFQAIGAERVEALCDAFTRQYEAEQGVHFKPRFSPGYGDLSLTVQKSIFAALNGTGKIGLSLNDSLLLSPSKSVTAFAGITQEIPKERRNRCALCERIDCMYRSTL